MYFSSFGFKKIANCDSRTDIILDIICSLNIVVAASMWLSSNQNCGISITSISNFCNTVFVKKLFFFWFKKNKTEIKLNEVCLKAYEIFIIFGFIYLIFR